MIDSALARQEKENNLNRIKAIETIQKSMQADYDRYYKKKKQWSIANNFLDYAETFVGIGFSITAIVVGFVTLNPLASGIIVATNAGITAMLITLRKSIFNREYNKFSKKLKNANKYQNRMWIIAEQIKQDGVVTVEELQKYVDLFDEYKNMKIEKQIEDKPDEITNFQRSIEQQAIEEAKQQIALELKENLKQKNLNDFRSRLNIPNLPNVPATVLAPERLI